MCSYFVCRNAGIKFRYCVYCKLPVAKRNFAKRHRHWGKIAPSDLPKDILDGTPGDDDLSTSEQGTIEIIKGEKQGEQGDDERDASVASSTRGSAPPANSHQWSSDELLGELMARNAEELQQEQTTPLEPLSDDTLARFVKERQVAWQDLLLRRPKSPSSSAMLGWVQEILRVSDVGGGAPPANSVIPTVAASGSFVGKDPVKDVVDTKSNVSNESECLNGTEHQPDALRSSETCNAGSKKSNGHSVMVATQNADKQEKGKEDVGEPAVVTGTQVNDRKVENDHEYDDDDDFDNEDDEYGDGEDEEGEIPDDASTSSEDSVDLRISKKAKTS